MISSASVIVLIVNFFHFIYRTCLSLLTSFLYAPVFHRAGKTFPARRAGRVQLLLLISLRAPAHKKLLYNIIYHIIQKSIFPSKFYLLKNPLRFFSFLSFSSFKSLFSIFLTASRLFPVSLSNWRKSSFASPESLSGTCTTSVT